MEKKPVTLSYSYGIDRFKEAVIPKFLGARNSVPSGSAIYNTFPTDYGVKDLNDSSKGGYGNPDNIPYNVTRYQSKPSTMRWYDAVKEKIAIQWRSDTGGTGNPPDEVYHYEQYRHFYTDELDIVEQKIQETLNNGGWLNNFTHWHNYYSDHNEEWIEPYLSLLSRKNSDNEIYFAGYGEAVAYLVYRQLITNIVMYSPMYKPDSLVIRLEAVNTIGIDTDLLQTPISVKFKTSNTILENQKIKCNTKNCQLHDIGNNQYIVEIPWSEYPCVEIIKDTNI